jgi:hypothetical protein
MAIGVPDIIPLLSLQGKETEPTLANAPRLFGGLPIWKELV